MADLASESNLSIKRRRASGGEGPVSRRMSRLEPRGSLLATHRRMSHASRHSSTSGMSWGVGGFKPQQRLANTYRMAPNKEEKFKSYMAERLIKGILSSYLEGESYNRTMCCSLAKSLADVIKERMKDQGWSQRYKYVCMVTLGELKDQGMAVASRCMWATETDSFASASFKKGNLFAVATVYAVYFE